MGTQMRCKELLPFYRKFMDVLNGTGCQRVSCRPAKKSETASLPVVRDGREIVLLSKGFDERTKLSTLSIDILEFLVARISPKRFKFSFNTRSRAWISPAIDGYETDVCSWTQGLYFLEDSWVMLKRTTSNKKSAYLSHIPSHERQR